MKRSTVSLGITLTMLLLVCCALPAVASDYTLGVFGNANEDDTINMQDVTQIELVILGSEKELTVLDSSERIVTIKKPVNRIIGLDYGADCEVLRALKSKDRVVGVTNLVTDRKVFYPELSEVTYIGSWMSPDIEKIIELNPELVIVPPGAAMFFDLSPLIDVGITTVYFDGFDGHNPTSLPEDVTKLGYILGKREEAEKFIDFIQNSETEIDERIKEHLPDEGDLPTVYMEGARGDYVIVGKTTPMARLCRLAGGRNIGDELTTGGCVNVDAEWVVSQNPDVIIKMQFSQELGIGGYESDDPSGMEEVRDDIMNRPGLANLEAVKTGRVYVMYCLALSPGQCVMIPYMAKALHPDIFDNLDPKEIHQQYLTEFQGLDYDVSEHGVFVYPLLEGS